MAEASDASNMDADPSNLPRSITDDLPTATPPRPHRNPNSSSKRLSPSFAPQARVTNGGSTLSDLSELNRLNWPLIDPPRWGWTAAGGIADVLTPHERARRVSTKKSFIRAIQRKRDRAGNLLTESSILVTDTADEGQGTAAFASTCQRTQRRSNTNSPCRNLSTSFAERNTLPSWKRPENVPEKQPDDHPVLQTKWNGKESKSSGRTQQHDQCGDSSDSQRQSVKNPLHASEPEYNSQLEMIDPQVAPLPKSGRLPLNGTRSARSAQQRNSAREDTTNPTVKNHQKRPPISQPLEFKALDIPGNTNGFKITSNAGEQVLDMYTYHRGREGMEYRDEETGCWLSDLPQPTDTNHHQKEPDTSVSVKIEFPLSNSQVFRDTITFNLIDMNQSGTTSMQLATDIALEFGLSYAETFDLAESIQTQLRSFHREHNPYSVPYATIIPHTGEIREVSQTRKLSVAWHGQPINQSQPGFEIKSDAVVETKNRVKDRRETQHGKTAKKSLSTSGSSVVGSKRKRPPSNRKRVTEEVDEVYVSEVKARLRQVGQQVSEASSAVNDRESKSATVDNRTDHAACHFCGQSTDVVQLICGRKDHFLCRHHLVMLESTKLSFCPICSLQCPCRSCVNKLLELSKLFRSYCMQRNSTPDKTDFSYLWQKALELQGPESSTKNRMGEDRSHAKAIARQSVDRIIVPKVPIQDFPREVADGVDIDPGTPIDYQAVYSEKGAEIPPDVSSTFAQCTLQTKMNSSATNTASTLRSTAEDGSVDYCNRCSKPGNLLCCDYCPRAFHSKCIKQEELENNSGDDTPWMCPPCCSEKQGLPEDSMDGKKYLLGIQSVYGEDGNNEMIIVLSIIQQMLSYLIEYDFGHMFAAPVEGVPDYNKIVSKPMDLGTIYKKLGDGSYKSQDESLEDIVVNVLNDIELVWQNCFAFNCEGSAVYRMAEIHRRRMQTIRGKSLDNYLTESMNERLREYLSQFGSKGATEEIWEPTGQLLSLPRTPSPQRFRHKITVPSRVAYNGRHVAVLDPDTRRLVKLYSTINASVAAIRFLLGLGHTCEVSGMENATKSKVQSWVNKSQDDPSLLLFGYRWLFMDNLRSGQVRFLSANGNGADESVKPPEDKLYAGAQSTAISSKFDGTEMLCEVERSPAGSFSSGVEVVKQLAAPVARDNSEKSDEEVKSFVQELAKEESSPKIESLVVDSPMLISKAESALTSMDNRSHHSADN